MANENEVGIEEQLKAFQTSYREVLSSRYGLDPVLANAIPLGTAQEMEEQAKAFHKSMQSAAGKPNATVPSVPQSDGSNGGGEASPRSAGLSVDALLASKYKGPVKRD